MQRGTDWVYFNLTCKALQSGLQRGYLKDNSDTYGVIEKGLQRGQTALQTKIACNAVCNAVFDDFGLCHQIRFDSKAAGLQRPRELDASLENALLTFFIRRLCHITVHIAATTTK